MAHFRGNRSAFGAPVMSLVGQAPPKMVFGTAHSMGGRVWFTIGQGILPRPTTRRSIALKCAIWSFCFPMETNCFSKKRGIWTTRLNESCLRRDIESADTILRGVSLS